MTSEIMECNQHSINWHSSMKELLGIKISVQTMQGVGAWGPCAEPVYAEGEGCGILPLPIPKLLQAPSLWLSHTDSARALNHSLLVCHTRSPNPEGISTGRNSSLWGQWGLGTGFLEKLSWRWLHHPWKCSMSHWTLKDLFGANWSGGTCHCLWHEGWNWMIYKVPF